VRLPPNGARQRLCKNVPSAKNPHATTEELLDESGVFNAVRVAVEGEWASQLDVSQIRETVQYDLGLRGTGNQVQLARSNNNFPDPPD
jgi:hypothetical protein